MQLAPHNAIQSNKSTSKKSFKDSLQDSFRILKKQGRINWIQSNSIQIRSWQDFPRGGIQSNSIEMNEMRKNFKWDSVF